MQKGPDDVSSSEGNSGDDGASVDQEAQERRGWRAVKLLQLLSRVSLSIGTMPSKFKAKKTKMAADQGYDSDEASHPALVLRHASHVSGARLRWNPGSTPLNAEAV